MRHLSSLLVLVFLVVQAWLTRDAPRGAAPEIRGTLLDGSPITLSSLQGQPVLLHFWATWCPICSLEQGSIVAIAQQHRVLTIAIDEGPAKARRVASQVIGDSRGDGEKPSGVAPADRRPDLPRDIVQDVSQGKGNLLHVEPPSLDTKNTPHFRIGRSGQPYTSPPAVADCPCCSVSSPLQPGNTPAEPCSGTNGVTCVEAWRRS